MEAQTVMGIIEEITKSVFLKVKRAARRSVKG
jgi:hypothetical protein